MNTGNLATQRAFAWLPSLATPARNGDESRPIEEVLFLRDEMASMAWGVERIIESTSERPINRFEEQRYVITPPSEQASESGG